MQILASFAGDCSAIWQIRLANPHTPDTFFANWRPANDTDISCCSSKRPWSFVECQHNRVMYLLPDCGTLPPAQRLSVLPPSIGVLSALQWLEVDNCAISALPDVFAGLQQLEWLVVYNTPLRTLPFSVAQTNIQEMQLIATSLMDITPVCNTTSLHVLSVAYNTKLGSVNCSFAKLTQLRNANFSNAGLTSFHAFDHCDGVGCATWPGLELYLDGNQVCISCFCILTCRCCLQLETLPKGILALQGSLTVDVSRNKIKIVSYQAFVRSGNLNLSRNAITVLDMPPLTPRGYVDVSHNKCACVCISCSRCFSHAESSHTRPRFSWASSAQLTLTSARTLSTQGLSLASSLAA